MGCIYGDPIIEGDPEVPKWLAKVRGNYNEVYNLITTAGLRVFKGSRVWTFTWTLVGSEAVRTRYLRPRLEAYFKKRGVALDANAIADLVVDHVVECNMIKFTVNIYVMTLNENHRLDYRILNALVVLMNSPAFNLSYISDRINSMKYDCVDKYIRKGTDIPNVFKAMMREALGRMYKFLLDPKNKNFGNVSLVDDDDNPGNKKEEFEIMLDEKVQNGISLRNHLINILFLLTSLFKLDVDSE